MYLEIRYFCLSRNQIKSTSRGPRGGCTPHFLFGCAEKKTGRARSKRKAAGARTCARSGASLGMYEGSQKETALRTFSRSVGRGPGLAEIFSFLPATDCHRAPGCRTDLTFFFPPLPLCPACGKPAAAKREAGPFVKHPESKFEVASAGRHHLCSPRERRTRYEPSSSEGTDSGDPRICAKRRPQGADFAPRRFFSLDRERPVSLFCAVKKEKWGVQLPP